MTLTDAIRTLRKLSGLNQQYYATSLEMATRSLSMYENGRTPEPKQLLAFAADAYRRKRGDLADIFMREFNEQLTPPSGFYLRVEFGPGGIFKQSDVEEAMKRLSRDTGKKGNK